MKNLKIIALLLSVGLFLTGCKTAEEKLMADGWFPMRGDQMASTFTSNTMSGKNGKDVWHVYFVNDSEAKASDAAGAQSGTWRIDGDKYCRTWDKWGKGKERCASLHRRGSEIRFPKGYSGMMSNGNSQGL